MMKIIVIATLCASSLAQHDHIRADFEKLQATKFGELTKKTHHEYSQDCWTNANLHIKANAASLLQQQNVPGAGIDEFKPFEKVLKDGFLPAACVKDYMYNHGDKFGDNRHSYKLGSSANVSIVHYDAFVPKEDQVEMTQKVCFEFCRTVPNMGFFGIANGRGCYCTPYFDQMAGDSSDCDAVCEGEKTLMCGGKSKSSIFAMHMCDSTAEDLSKRSRKAGLVQKEIESGVKRAKKLSTNMQDTAAKLQQSFGAVGDSGATALMQEAKVFAGDLVHQAEDAEAGAAALGELSKSASALNDFADPATVTKAERVMEGIDGGVAKGIDLFDELATLEAWAVGEHEARKMNIDENVAHPPALESSDHTITIVKGKYCAGPYAYFQGLDLDACAKKVLSTPEECTGGHFDHENGGCFCQRAGDCHDKVHATPYNVYKVEIKKKGPPVLDQYYPVMYFVDKDFEKVPTTCNGKLAGKPITGQDANGCAAACDANIHSCVGFQHFNDGKNDLCFLFENFETGSYYTGCGTGKSFLQAQAAPFEAKCYAKLSKFVGTTLKPNPSGKCKECFKKLTKADRCYK